jgi:ATP synthase protein I
MTATPPVPTVRAGAPFELLLRGAVWPSAAAGAVAVVGVALWRGPGSLLSGVLGLVVGLGYFAAGLLLLSRLLRDRSPLAFMAVGMAIYLGQVLVLLVFMLAFLDAAWLDGRAFGVVVLVVTLAWQVALWRTTRRGRLLVFDEPTQTGGAA